MKPMWTDNASTSPDNPHGRPPLTAGLPGTGGAIKQAVEDFQVEEIPAYEPCGEGEHLFLWIEKRDTSAEQLTRHISRVLGISAGDVGVAGLKDRRAVTRQYVSVPAVCADRVDDIEMDNIHVLRAVRHRNKLRAGHSRGNRFSVLVRGTDPDALVSAERIRQRIAASGFPNYFGPQRYGVDGETLKLGIGLLRGEKRPRDVPASRRRFLLRLALSAAQSYLFDLALADRLTDGLFDRVHRGDVMQVALTGGPFRVEDVSTEQQRFDAGETTITGPMFGPKMLAPDGEPLARERRVLEACEVSEDDFLRHRKLTPGTRRPYLARPQDFSITREGDGLRFDFALPRGVYATSMLRELMKTAEY